MILHPVHQHTTNDISYNSGLNSKSMLQSEYHRTYRSHDDKDHYYNQPSPLSATLPFFKFSKSPDIQGNTSTPEITGKSLNNYHSSSVPVSRRTSAPPTQDHAYLNNKTVPIPSLLNSDIIRGPSARSISLDSSCFNLPKIDVDSSEKTSRHRGYLRSQSCGSITPPPSLPPLSETLSNIFTNSPRMPPFSYENHNADATSVLPSSCCSAISSPTGKSKSPSHMQVLPPILLHEPSTSDLNTNGSCHRETSYFDEHPSTELNLNHSQDEDKKVFSFVALPGINGKKRPRRKFDEIERLYKCNWTGCSKSYGTLNHLNAHVMMQKHGNKRLPNEFKELRKHWKKRKED